MDESITPPQNIQELETAYNFADNILKFDATHPRNLQFYKNVYSQNPEYILLFKPAGEVGGVIFASDKDRGTLLIGELAVSETMRGRGIGSKLLSEMEEVALKHDKKEIFLAALETAEKFYIRNGYFPKLYVQLDGNNRLDEITSLSATPVSWKNTGDGFSKVVLDTVKIDKELQKNFEDKLGAHTQYLFFKALTL
ncbi:hypothetical protein A2380_01585 [candidate division WWE3 bacterium RIFOXYB1_FULL_43_24]|uniref:N-acetyltransferase domain-containing protein n=2 Tax=Katanobacteria TaxID=422282 RepID=A0A0G1AP49_UNCKA|nr:MAG: hypothetical protein UU92_C0025G0001 [candidate division WWE3 bacterium GW2011_GWA1_42_12]KKS33388.1 MAG: hypothetical protein UU97_C0032G0001 [candidate division WWE3 bacterium GW2011_GWD1_42_14]KKS35831.1 MAG: hypothetical protein UV00_C0030G0007 [candidate division WWE3 bacterium GW2011_GWF1_42_14]KKS39608.1 MAG: hypothetical protein UV03_C0027G0007 [candidate division WWE3 bacterium GW2011_GWE1_42_16]KKS65582.1 MAG: hypothetical protein UV35_C0038G0001 [candidate division WWE3 bacte